MNSWKPYLGRLIFTVLGLVSAILFLVLGFGKTMLILLCCGIGYAAGICRDKGINVIETLLSLRNRW